MNHNLPHPSDGERASEPDWQSALRKKIRLAGAITNERFGTPNPLLRAELLYDALAHPDTVVAKHEIDVSRFADRRSVLEAELLRPDVTVEHTPFVEFMLALMRDPTIHQESMVPGFEQALTAFAARGPVTIWTQGDVYDAPPRGEGTIPGWGEQLWKLEGGGIVALQQKLAQTALGTLSLGNSRAVLEMIAVSDKFNPDTIDQLVERVSGADHVLVVEDRLDHILRLRGMLGKRGIRDIKEFWVNRGRQEPPEGTVKVGRVTDIPALLDGIEGSIGAIIDFDDVLSDQTKRIELTAEAVEQYLRRNGALKEE